MKGGVIPRGLIVSSSVRPSSGRPSALPLRPSAAPRPSTTPLIPSEYPLVDEFFKYLEDAEFDKALCALYNLYNTLPFHVINEILRSNSFKIRYEDNFYTKELKKNYHGFISCNIHANRKYIIFLSYIFKKLMKGGFIYCNGTRKYFVYSREKSRVHILTVLKKFLGYLDTACVNTTSYPITAERYDEISKGKATGVTHEERAMFEIVSNLKTLAKNTEFQSLKDILHNMTTKNQEENIVSYQMNTTVLSRFIRQSYTDFLEDKEVSEMSE